MRSPGRRGQWKTADDQPVGGQGKNAEAGLSSLDAAGNGIGGRDRLVAGRFQGGAEGVHPRISSEERVIGWEKRRRGAAGKCRWSGYPSKHVAEGIRGRDREGVSGAGVG